MALVLADRVRETTVTTGTGAISLAGAVTGYQSFAAVGNGNTTYYCIAGQGTAEWEVGIGTYTSSGATLSRDTVLSSSNSGSKVSFSAGAKDVFVTYPSERSVNYDGSNNLTLDNTITISGGTANQVQFLNASKVLSGSTNLTWNGTTLAVTGALTASTDSSFTSTGALQISKGTTGQQPGSPATGMIRYNTTTNQFEGYSGASPAWKSIGGSALSNDTSTASNLYPVFAGATTGTAENLYTSNAKLLYKPSTGELSATVPRADNGIFVNNATVSTSYTIAAGDNGLSAGTITVANGVTVTVSNGSKWTVV